jgi:mitogen-activated protein kinase kinase kinase
VLLSSIEDSLQTKVYEKGINFDQRKSPIIWKKGEVIGSGSFGTVNYCTYVDEEVCWISYICVQVFLARNDITGELMVVKEIFIGEETESDVLSLLEEVNLLKSLEHENIVKYMGSSYDKEAKKIHIFTV